MRNNTGAMSEFTNTNVSLVDVKDCAPNFYIECLVALWIWRTIPLVLVFFGTCGNIMSIVILSRLLKYSTSVFLLMLAVAELFFLWLYVTPITIYALTSTWIDVLGEWICRLRFWITYTSAGFSVWVLVLLNVERILRVKAPIFSRINLTPRNSFIIAVTVLLVITVLNLHFTFGLTVLNNSNFSRNKTCYFRSEEHKQFSENVWSWINLILFMLLPGSIILVGNINIALALISRRKRFNRVNPLNTQKTSIKEKINSSSTLLLFILCSFFLVTTMPFCIYKIVNVNSASFEGRVLARWQLAYCIVSVLIYSNFSFNFFFYFVRGTLFKREWEKVMMELKNRLKNRMNNPH